LKTEEKRNNNSQFVIAWLGLSYKTTHFIDIYSNISQNYRSITFSDMRISNPSYVIDPEMTDEKGYSLDACIRSEKTTLFNYDVSVFYLNYNNRIGEVSFYEDNRFKRKRTNIGQAIIRGLEFYAEADLLKLVHTKDIAWSGVLFSNFAFLNSTYKKSIINGVEGNKVEFVPDYNLKTGVRLGYKNLKFAFQYTYLSDQFTEATNARDEDVSAVFGLIPAYSIMDAGLSYKIKRFRIEANANNLTNNMYFTRRATGYPGPGILPSDGRSFYITLQAKI
jgi:Fe(3+) dicitrate transport protein